MSARAKLEQLRVDVADHACQIEDLFKSPVKVTILVRNPAWPNGDRDVLTTNDEDVRGVLRAIDRLDRTCDNPPPGGVASAPETDPRAETDHAENLVAGRVLPTSLADFVRACAVLLEDEQNEVAPDNALIGTLCNAVRLAREYADVWKTGRRV